MVSRFNVGDLVKFDNRVYIIKYIILMNPEIKDDCFVCGLVPVEKPNKIEQLLVREKLLVRINNNSKERS